MKKKGKQEYDYRFNVYQIETDKGLQWHVEYPDVSAVVGGGDSPEEAIAEAKENLKVYLDYLKDEKIELPKASKYESEYSGKVTLRMSHSLHKKITELSDFEGQSINSYINEALIEKTQSVLDGISFAQFITEKEILNRNIEYYKILSSKLYDISDISENYNNCQNDQNYFIDKDMKAQYSA